MQQDNRNAAMLEVFMRGIELSNRQDALLTLGNRSDYIGMSELSRYPDCPRAAIAAKLNANPLPLADLITISRGHWFENGIGQCIESLKLNPASQLEISIRNGGVQVKAHLDFTIAYAKPYPAVRIVEVKSQESIPDTPYAAHERQLTGQVSLLKRHWNEPVFSVPACGAKTFPQLCRDALGVALPEDPTGVSIEGWLLCLSMRDARAFGPYNADRDALESMLEDAATFWPLLQEVRAGSKSLNDVPYTLGFHPLCTCCRANADCPKFTSSLSLPSWESALKKLDALKAQRNSIDSDIKEIEAALKQAHQLSGTQDWIESGGYRFRFAQTAGRRTLDKVLLETTLGHIFEDAHIDADAGGIIAGCEKVGAPSGRLYVQSINR